MAPGLPSVPCRLRHGSNAAWTESWNDLGWRTEQIHAARAHEAAERWVERARQVVQAPIVPVENAG